MFFHRGTTASEAITSQDRPNPRSNIDIFRWWSTKSQISTKSEILWYPNILRKFRSNPNFSWDILQENCQTGWETSIYAILAKTKGQFSCIVRFSIKDFSKYFFLQIWSISLGRSSTKSEISTKFQNLIFKNPIFSLTDRAFSNQTDL